MSRHCRAMGFVSPSLSTVASPLRVRPWSCCLRERPEPWVLTVQARKADGERLLNGYHWDQHALVHVGLGLGKRRHTSILGTTVCTHGHARGQLGQLDHIGGPAPASDEPSALSGLTADIFSKPLPLRILLGQVLGRNEDSLATLAQSERSTSSTPEAR